MQLTIQYSETSLEKALQETFASAEDLLRDLKIGDDNSVIDIATYLQQLRQLTRAVSEPLKIAVVGDFKRGKSTFVNALLGRDIVTMDVLPETVLITEVHAGNEERTEIHLEDGGVILLQTEDRVSTRLTSIIEHIQKPIRHLKIVHDNSNLDNIMLVDTPGLGDLNWRFERMVQVWIQEADVIFYVTAAISPLSQTERQFLYSTVKPLDMSSFQFVVNMMDQMSTAEERTKILNRVRTELHRDFKDASVIGISAKEALLKQLDPAEEVDQDLYKTFQGMQQDLKSVYAEQKNLIRSERSAKRLSVLLQFVERDIQIRMNDVSGSSLTDRLRSLEQELENIPQQYQDAMATFENKIASFKSDTVLWMSEFVERFYDEVIPQFETQDGEHAQRHFPFFASDVFREALGSCIHHHLRELEAEHSTAEYDNSTMHDIGDDVAELSQRTNNLFNYGLFTGNAVLLGGLVQLYAVSSSISMLGQAILQGNLAGLAVSVGLLAGSSVVGMFKDSTVSEADAAREILAQSKENLKSGIHGAVEEQYDLILAEIHQQQLQIQEQHQVSVKARVQNLQQLLLQDEQQQARYRTGLETRLTRCTSLREQIAALRTRQVSTLSFKHSDNT